MRVLSFLLCLLFVNTLQGANPAQVKSAYVKGAQYLNTIYEQSGGGKKTLVALAIYKAGLPKDSGPVKETLGEILSRIKDGKYRPGGEHLYEAGIDATFLADLDPAKYQAQIKAIADYIVGSQKSNGGWDYPSGRDDPKFHGDTSVIQYACLGLWAAERAAIEIDDSVWKKVLDWHVTFQNPDGGFAYCPRTTTGHFQDRSTLNMTAAAVANMHIAMLHIDPTFLPLKQELQREKSENNEAQQPKFGVLEAVNLDTVTEKTVSVKIPPEAVASVRKAFNWLGVRFKVENKESPHATYYYYTVERMGALADVIKIGSSDWFDSCANYLLSKQKADGSWDESNYFDTGYDTAFCVLFMTRSTGKLLKRVEPAAQFGDGLLAGGRGLPDDLTDVDFNGRSVKMKEKPTEPLDILLASLSKTGGLENLDVVQKQIVEQVQLGNREDLIGQVDQLVKLVDHPDPGIRQTVVWALGRTGDMQLAQHLITRLSDSDLGVMIEARNALCWMSRKPLGFGYPEDPLIDLSDKATPAQKNAVIAQWHKNLVLKWGDWYLNNRPFEDRGDAFEAELQRKMDKLKYGF